MTPEELRAFRFRYGLPQAELAAVLGVSRTTIIALERGRSRPTRLHLLALAAYAAGLSPYGSNPADVAALAASRRLRISSGTGCGASAMSRTSPSRAP